MTSLWKRLMAGAAVLAAAVMGFAPAASACGFLVSANGGVRLTRTTTFVAWDDGLEHYITSFAFEGELESFGSLVPLPAAPTDVAKAGSWTLQRLVREVRPPAPSTDLALSRSDAAEAAGVEILIETRIESLDVVVLRGGSQAVLDWVNDNGFNLPPGPATDHMLSYYGSRSPYWMATRFDAEAALEAGFQAGDGIPVQVTIPTVRPWVPLHILHGAAADSEIIEADVFLLTPERPELLHGEGLVLNQSKPADDLLLSDLGSEEGMEWIPDNGWFTHLELNTAAENLTYDLSVGVGEVSPSRLDAGLDLPMQALEDMHGESNNSVTSGELAQGQIADGHSHDGISGLDVIAVSLVGLLAAGFGALATANLSLTRRLRSDESGFVGQ
ncbi:MAG: DUF2330 domain-containing protein [Acidimicrobiales bacterium]|nr:DUF2330 domain-containing protein [Acidimicrobiales bacterium]